MRGNRADSTSCWLPVKAPHRNSIKHSVDPSRHHRLLAEAQRLRGRIYLQDGAIQPSDLLADDRHIQAADDQAWHLLTVDENEAVVACIRYFAHEPGVRFSELSVAGSDIARSAELGTRVREAVETELDCARRRGVWFVELGGWAVCESLRCTTEAIRTLLTVYALSQVRGGAVGLSSATTRHHSSSILRRIGGRPLKASGVEVSSYYDAQYACEMELLSFDSESPNPRYASWIQVTAERCSIRFLWLSALPCRLALPTCFVFTWPLVVVRSTSCGRQSWPKRER